MIIKITQIVIKYNNLHGIIQNMSSLKKYYTMTLVTKIHTI